MKKKALAIGIDIGGTNTSFGIVDKRGTILVQNSMSTTGHDKVEDYLEAIHQKLQPLLKQVDEKEINGVGVGAPNANFYTGEIAHAVNLPWKGIIPLAKLLKEKLKHEVTITNDANAAALGEMTYGAAKGMKDFVMVTLGTGVGSGFVSNGALIYGNDGFAGELGHVNAVRDGRICGCGRKGCLEAYASATGIVRTAKEWLSEKNMETSLTEENLSSKAIFEAAEAGDKLALALFEFTGKILGQTLADIVAITSPEAFVFFGGLARAGKYIMEPTQKHMEANLLKVFKNKVGLIHSALPAADAAILGASALVW